MAKEDQTKKPKEKRGIDQSQKVINARVSVDEFKARQDELYLGKDPDPNRKISENSILTGCTNHNSDETILSQFTIKGKNGAGVYTIPPAVQRPIPGTPKDIKQNAMNRDTNRGASANKSYQNPIDEIPVANYNADSGRGKTNRSKKRGLSHKSDRKGDKKTEPPTKNSAMENEQPERPSNKEKYPPWYYTADDDKKQDGSDEQVPPVGVLPAAPGSRSSSTPADKKTFHRRSTGSRWLCASRE